MKKFTKSVSLILMICVICSTMSVFVSAQVIKPLWTNIDTMSLTITFSGSSSFTRGVATKQSGVTSMEGTVTLYRNVSGQWIYIDQWSGSSTGNSLIITGYFSCISGVQYEAVFEVTAYRGSSSETATQITYKTCT